MKTDDVVRSPLGREQLVALAKKAGFDDLLIKYGEVFLTKFAALVAAHEREKLKNVAIFSRWYEELDKAVLAEREACAKLCEEIIASVITKPMPLKDIVAAIRARGEK